MARSIEAAASAPRINPRSAALPPTATSSSPKRRSPGSHTELAQAPHGVTAHRSDRGANPALPAQRGLHARSDLARIRRVLRGARDTARAELSPGFAFPERATATN